MYEFERDERNNMALKNVLPTGGVADVTCIVVKILRIRSLLSLLPFNEVICADGLTGRWLGARGAGTPEANTWA